MPTGWTELDVFNEVLDMLSQSRVISSAEYNAGAGTTPEVKWFLRNYARTVRSALRANIWTFAKEQDTLTADATAPEFDYGYRYLLPTTWLRIFPITYQGNRLGELVHFELFGRYIHTDDAGPLYVRGIDDRQDPASWDDHFTDVIVASLAGKYAPKLTGKVNYIQRADAMLQRALDTAISNGAIEEMPEPIEAHDIIRVRTEI